MCGLVRVIQLSIPIRLNEVNGKRAMSGLNLKSE